MKRGGKILCSVAVFAIAACASEQGKLEVRSTKTALAPGEKPVPYRVAEGWSQLALNNVGLALQSFRMGLRDDPSSTAALLGLAVSYDKMGRFDLSRRHYEMALAIAPGDTNLLGALAASLDLQGRGDEAASVRSEIAQRLAAAALPATPAAPEAKPVVAASEEPVVQPRPAVEEPRAVVAMLPVPEPVIQPQAAADEPRAVVAMLPAPEPMLEARATPQGHIEFVPTRVEAPTELPAPAPEIVPAAVAPVAAPVALAEVAPAQPARSVTIKLPPPRPMAAPFVEAKAEPSTAVVAAVTAQAPRAEFRREANVEGPRLVRLSRGEIALVTAPGPIWRSEPVTRTARSTTVRFVPVRQAERPAEVRLLNAARVHRLAARTRAYLSGRGWRDISIGDAEATRRKSLILYPRGERDKARKLSVQFGFAIAPNDRVRQVTVLLGRDSVRVAGARAGA